MLAIERNRFGLVAGLLLLILAWQGLASAQEPVALTADDVALLKLASDWHYHNGTRLSGSFAGFLAHDRLLAREQLRPGASGEFAKQIVFMYFRAAEKAELVEARSEAIKKFSDTWLQARLQAGLEVLQNFRISTVAEIRQAPSFQTMEKWVDNLRANEIGRLANLILSADTGLKIANVAEELYGPRLAMNRLDPKALSVTTYGGDQYGRGVGKFLALKYQGAAPLTNVLIVGRLKTTGARPQLIPGQQGILAANALFGFADKNKDVGDLFILHNTLESMPRAGIVFVPVLKPGDTLQIGLGDVRKEFLRGGEISLYSDQGRLPKQDVDLTVVPVARKGWPAVMPPRKTSAPLDPNIPDLFYVGSLWRGTAKLQEKLAFKLELEVLDRERDDNHFLADFRLNAERKRVRVMTKDDLVGWQAPILPFQDPAQHLGKVKGTVMEGEFPFILSFPERKKLMGTFKLEYVPPQANEQLKVK